ISFLSEGHVLLEDLPGMGKTMMVRAFAKSLNLPFNRIQFTPDLLPSDITGLNFYNQKDKEFEFRKGPLFSNIILADEINRATPRTQSSLLEAMEENQITVDGDTRLLKSPFMVLATQNPVESFGTFPLPEAQMDRFFMRIKMGYPKKDEERLIIRNSLSNNLKNLKSVVNLEELDYLKLKIKNVEISDEIMDYLLDIVNLTREKSEIERGISPRGSIALSKASQTYAALNGRDYVIPEDIKEMSLYVLNHRIIIYESDDIISSMKLIEDIVNEVDVPLEQI
ncbi:MAG: AAA domain-containing protein, partial [Clostridium sp.]|nr:AAA domain-containing protein [Clostridium sp.]